MGMARVVLITRDLMFGSKVEAMVREAGFECSVSAATPDDDGTADALWIVDLAQGDFAPEDFADRKVPILAYYAHVDGEIRERALDAGLTKVVPRSRMAREGTNLIKANSRK